MDFYQLAYQIWYWRSPRGCNHSADFLFIGSGVLILWGVEICLFALGIEGRR